MGGCPLPPARAHGAARAQTYFHPSCRAGLVDQVTPGWVPSPKCPRASLQSSKPGARPQLLPTTGDGAAWGGQRGAAALLGAQGDLGRGKKMETRSPRLAVHTPRRLLPRFLTGGRNTPRNETQHILQPQSTAALSARRGFYPLLTSAH